MRNDYKLLATDLLPNSIMFDDREEDRGAAEAAGLHRYFDCSKGTPVSEVKEYPG